jgi:hypothetical protein
MTGLERRYRRLLALYPWSHRRRYEEEMLTVLLAGAKPGRRRPGVGDTLNVLAAAVKVRLRAAPGALAAPAWSEGAAVTSLLMSLALVAGGVGSLVSGMHKVPGGLFFDTDVNVGWAVLGWALVALSAGIGWRRTAAGLGWLATAAEIVVFVHQYRLSAVAAVDLAWQVVLAGVAAAALTVAALAVARPRRSPVRLVGRGRFGVVALSLAALVAVPLVRQLNETTYQFWPNETTYVAQPLTGVYVVSPFESTSALYATLAGKILAGLIVAVAVATLAPSLRRRVVAFALPAAVPVLVDWLGLAGWRVSTGSLGQPVPLVLAQWLMLFGLPVLVGLAATAYVQRREHLLRMVALGHAADLAEPE